MRRETHVKIARALSRELHLPKDLEKYLVRGIVAPDSRRRRRPKSKHHRLLGESTFWYIMNARRSYLKGDLASCLYNLGVALHFVQDAYIPSPRTRTLRKVHDAMERKIGKLGVPTEEVAEGFRSAVSSPEFVRKAIAEVRWVYDAEEALRRATRLSAAIAAAVLERGEPPEGLLAEYAAAKVKHRKYVKAGWAVFLLGSLAGVLTFNLKLALLLTFASALAGTVVVLLDKQFYEVKERAVWYGIEN